MGRYHPTPRGCSKGTRDQRGDLCFRELFWDSSNKEALVVDKDRTLISYAYTNLQTACFELLTKNCTKKKLHRSLNFCSVSFYWIHFDRSFNEFLQHTNWFLFDVLYLKAAVVFCAIKMHPSKIFRGSDSKHEYEFNFQFRTDVEFVFSWSFRNVREFHIDSQCASISRIICAVFSFTTAICFLVRKGCKWNLSRRNTNCVYRSNELIVCSKHIHVLEIEMRRITAL